MKGVYKIGEKNYKHAYYEKNKHLWEIYHKKKHPKGYSWLRNLEKVYGITEEDWNKMFVNQEGCCLICGRHQSELKCRLCIDHDHETKKIRGLICKICNINLAWYEARKDNILKYLN